MFNLKNITVPKLKELKEPKEPKVVKKKEVFVLLSTTDSLRYLKRFAENHTDFLSFVEHELKDLLLPKEIKLVNHSPLLDTRSKSGMIELIMTDYTLTIYQTNQTIYHLKVVIDKVVHEKKVNYTQNWQS